MKTVVGLTGPTGSGKSTVAARFAAAGFVIVDADRIAREAVAPGSALLPVLADAFGAEILRPDGSLDRAALARVAFATAENTARLNAITHPTIVAAIKAEIEAADGRPVLLDAPQLFEGGCESLCTVTLGVLADRDVRLSRIMRRDGLSEEDARRRMDAQPDDDFYRQNCDAVLYNNGEKSELVRAADAWIRQFFGGRE